MLIALQSKEKRKAPRHHDVHWDAMSAEQKIALYDLHKFGFRLLFVRQLPSGPQAFIMQNKTLAVISKNGDVDYSPDVKLRA
ncbi:hypothetical protein [Shewanella sp. MBTL60-007]|uniref:hypothetical protein n=1 Tax=Shewanella sp. MBTL60-007 TaxID=2815911 RepID=UPI001BB9153B|nr:hypothetical protein [Shewanella sp. MBTL60-007]GIU15761.1 hypothetical protein TUM3792_08490 [Shewanella sp. MBTL60-007]